MFFRMFLRSFFIQAGWNFERFQNLGFAFCLQPALERFYPDKEKLKAATLRHLQIFNTQPYLASFVLGNVVRMEEEAAAAPDTEAALRSMPGVKQALASSFAAIGDRIFWGRLKPMTAQICLLVWSAGGFLGWLFTGLETPVSTALIFAGPLAGIVFYAAFSVYWRWHGLRTGYSCGGAASCGLGSSDWPRMIRLLSTAGFVMSLALAVLSLALLAAMNCGSCGAGDIALKLGVPLGVLALHRAARALGKSVFFAAGAVLAVSLFLFVILGLQPFKFYI